MDVTLLGMVMEVRLLQPSKAYLPMDVTLLGMTVFLQPAIRALDDVSMMALQLSRESYFALPVSTTIEVKPLQRRKAVSPMDVTLLGMVTEVKPLHPWYL